MSFQSFGLADSLIESLEELNFKTPTLVQQKTIPLVIAGCDVLVSSQTGTGKTGAFCIPIVSRLLGNLTSSALILTPTRELASQVVKVLNTLVVKSKLKVALLIGGEAIDKQFKQLKQRPHVIVGTPGRINDHLKRKSLNLSNVKFLVLDETDRMLDMGFSVQINDIVKYLPTERQTLLFSATLPLNIIKIANKYMKSPQRIAVGSAYNPVDKIKQETISINNSNKYQELVLQLNRRKGSIIVFVKTKHNTESISKKLCLEDHKASALHGNLNHNKRQKITQAFRDQKNRILVATDIAARGLDIPHVQHIINYDLPQCPEDYIHRIGRTARAGQNGEALSFISSSEKEKWNAIQRFMNPRKQKVTKNTFFKRT